MTCMKRAFFKNDTFKFAFKLGYLKNYITLKYASGFLTYSTSKSHRCMLKT